MADRVTQQQLYDELNKIRKELYQGKIAMATMAAAIAAPYLPAAFAAVTGG